MTVFELVFFAMHVPVGVGWGLLLFAPRHRLTARWVHGGWLILGLCALYLVLLFCGVVLGMAAEGAGMGSLGAVHALFSHPVGLLTGWAHFLAFDLFVGAWIARDAARGGWSHRASLPALLLTLFFGPLGLGLHLVMRARRP